MKHESHYIGYDIASLGIVVKLSFKRKIIPRSSEHLIESLLREMAQKYIDKAGKGVLRAKTFLTCSNSAGNKRRRSKSHHNRSVRKNASTKKWTILNN
jgi:hypothetical protein